MTDTRNIVALSGESLMSLPGFAQAFDHLLKQVVQDCQLRPGVKSPPRKVKVTFVLTPQAISYEEDGRVITELKSIGLGVQLGVSAPAMETMEFDMRAHGDGELLVNLDCPHDYERRMLPGMSERDALPFVQAGG